jgi:hypothetical protein
MTTFLKGLKALYNDRPSRRKAKARAVINVMAGDQVAWSEPWSILDWPHKQRVIHQKEMDRLTGVAKNKFGTYGSHKLVFGGFLNNLRHCHAERVVFYKFIAPSVQGFRWAPDKQCVSVCRVCGYSEIHQTNGQVDEPPLDLYPYGDA